MGQIRAGGIIVIVVRFAPLFAIQSPDYRCDVLIVSDNAPIPANSDDARPILRRSLYTLPSLAYCMRLVVGFSQASQIAIIVVC